MGAGAGTAAAAAAAAAMAAGAGGAAVVPPPWHGLGMPPVDAPFATATFRGMPALITGATPADSTLAAALLAAKSEAAAAQERVRAAAIAWERERSAADALARRVAEADHYILLSSGQQPVVPFAEHAASSSYQAPPSGSGPRLDSTDPMIAQLHL